MPKTSLMSTAKRFLPLLIPLAVLLLYFPFLENPLIFDDQYFFLPGNPEQYVEQGLQFKPRWLSYFSHGLTFVWLGDGIIWQRAGNLAIHAACGLALYKFLSCLLRDLGPSTLDPGSIQRSAALTASLFVLHPAAVFATGYLIQRTTLLATFFCLCSWTLFWLGLKGNRLALWASLPAFALAAWSKEHSVMAPAVNACLLIAHMRTPSTIRIPWRDTLVVLGGQLVISALLVGFAARWIGTPYELSAAALIEQSGADKGASPANAHLLSIVSQCGLFFKYLALWALPDGSRMSIDMREQFAASATSWQAISALVAFSAWGAAGFLSLLKGRTWSLIGIALLSPWIMFGTEIAALRIQEIFVLYRSYLWIGPTFLLCAILIAAVRPGLSVPITAVLCMSLYAFSWNKLYSMSIPILLWEEAADLLEKHPVSPLAGSERIFHSRGIERGRMGFASSALEDFDKALSINPKYVDVLGDRAATRLQMADYQGALDDFNKALETAPLTSRFHAGRAQALAGLGLETDSRNAHLYACALGWMQSCTTVDSSPERK